MLCGVLFSMRTPDGTLVVELPDPEATIQVLDASGKLLIEQKAGAEKVEIGVVPGLGRLRVVKNGVELLTKEFSLVSGGRETINARLEAPSAEKSQASRELPNSSVAVAPPNDIREKTTPDSNRLTDAEHAAGWMLLFHGENTSEWHLSDPQGAPCWAVENGQLVCTWRPGGADLVSNSWFQDFDLHLEFCLDRKANSGVYLKGLYEVQLYDHTSQPTNADERCGAIYGLIAPSKDAFKGPGTWNSLDVRLVGHKVSVTLNGEQVIEDALISGPTRGSYPGIAEQDPGPIVLQCHAPQAKVRFRNLRVKALKGVQPASSVDDGGKQTAEPAKAKEEKSASHREIDLLKIVDPARDAVLGKWSFVNGSLVGEPADGARIEIPYDPPEENDYRIVFVPTGVTSGVTQICPRRRQTV